ncbi:hypothetical protein IIB34_05750 [PVC group bacterium]|nr:hypothetical protein [PVC group bacterium]
MKRKNPSLKKQTYQLADDGSFIIHDYNFAKPFSSFFPGVSGLWGRPLWAFYVNRGQGLVSFGSLDKDRAIMEFLPANQAYERVGLLGFRTFIKVRRKNKEPVFYEPFLNTKDNQDARVKNQMRITSYDLRIEEINTRLGLKVTVRYFPLPAESIGALVRLVKVENIGRTNVKIEVLDGMPKVVPYGMDNFCLKNISRTIESMMKVSNYDKGVPFFHLKTEPQDRPEVVLIKSGSFYLKLLLS